MDWTAKNDVADSVLTGNNVTILVECVIVVVRTDTLGTVAIAVSNIQQSFITSSWGVITHGSLGK